MKRNLLTIGFSLFFGLVGVSQNSQRKSNVTNPIKIQTNFNLTNKSIPTHFIPAPDMAQIHADDAVRDAKGILYRIGVSSFMNLTSDNSGLWSTLANGDKKWQLAIHNPGAEALSFIFKDFILSEGATFWVENRKGEKVSAVLTNKDQIEDFQQHIALCFGDDLILNMVDKAYANPSTFVLNRVIYNYRSTGNPNPSGPQKINESGTCEVNVNCPEGALYQDEKRGVARVYVVESSGAGWCSGTLVNNTAQNCKPLFLTALHCGPSVNVSAANMLLWKFYFGYEAPSCTNPTSVGTLANHYITSCIRLADSNDNDGTNIAKDDFLLVQMGTLANEAATITTLKSSTFNAYWNGWDANTTAAASGVGIHHPAGDIKKISTFSAAVTSSTYSGTTANTHWKANWVTTATSWGVTEGGSSGSPLFVGNGGNARVIGTLSGGPSGCGVATSSAYDLYGKMSYHWVTDGTTSALSLKYHLDPGNTGLLILDGSADPCTPTSTVASVSITSSDADNIICTGTSVTFTATPTNGGTTPTYQWKLNGTNISGATSATYTTSALTNGQSITCVMTSNLSGVTSSPATSSAIVTTVNATPSTPSITQSGALLTSSSSTGNQWYLNGTAISSSTSSTYTASQSGSYTVVVTANGCSSTASSPLALTVATVSIVSNDANNTICAGTSVTFTATAGSGGSSPVYQWKVNGSNVGTNSSTYTTTSLTNGQSVTCVMTSNQSGVISSPATSNAIVTTVNAIPSTPTITQAGSQLTSSSSTGNQWYLNGNIISGATSQTYHVLQTGNYTVVVTSNGCNSSASAISNVDVTGINEVNVESSIVSIYPNPNNGQFTLTFTTVELMNYNIQLHDANGKLVFENELKNFTGSYSKEVDVTKNGKGEYFLSITNSKNQKIEKVIVY